MIRYGLRKRLDRIMAINISRMLFAILVTFCLGAALSLAQTSQSRLPNSADKRRTNEALRQELLRMKSIEQEARQRWITAPDLERERVYKTEVEPVDRKNTARLREIVGKYGWPGIDLVSRDGAEAAFTLLLHTPDHEFRKKCLTLTKEAAEKGEVPRFAVAMLTYKVLVDEGKPQVYGTHVNMEDGKPVVWPIEDEANVDERRAAVGLEPMGEYLKKYEEMYAPMLKKK
jgi:hypothetical protein